MQFGELLFIYFPQLLFFAVLILFIAIVSPVLLAFVVFEPKVLRPKLSEIRQQDIFAQTLRLSIDPHILVK